MRFEATDLFIQAVLENITSFQEAQQILDSGPTIKIQNEWLYLSCPGRKLIALCDCEDSDDECGPLGGWF